MDSFPKMTMVACYDMHSSIFLDAFIQEIWSTLKELLIYDSFFNILQ